MNQQRLEDALTPRDRVFLTRLLELVGIDAAHWERVSWLRETFELLAVEAETDRVQAECGWTRGRARFEACRRLWLDADSIRKRMQRARAASRGDRLSLNRGAA